MINEMPPSLTTPEVLTYLHLNKMDAITIQMHFHEWKLLHFDQNFIEPCP